MERRRPRRPAPHVRASACAPSARCRPAGRTGTGSVLLFPQPVSPAPALFPQLIPPARTRYSPSSDPLFPRLRSGWRFERRHRRAPSPEPGEEQAGEDAGAPWGQGSARDCEGPRPLPPGAPVSSPATAGISADPKRRTVHENGASSHSPSSRTVIPPARAVIPPARAPLFPQLGPVIPPAPGRARPAPGTPRPCPTEPPHRGVGGSWGPCPAGSPDLRDRSSR